MKTVEICLDSIDKVKAFVNEITRFDSEFDLISGRYVIDAKSIMGIFSLDLSKPITLNIHAEKNIDEIMSVIKLLSLKQFSFSSYSQEPYVSVTYAAPPFLREIFTNFPLSHHYGSQIIISLSLTALSSISSITSSK